jgi:hypothetical protein
MTTATMIERIGGGIVGMVFWGYAIYSIVVGFRDGFRFPRSLRWVALSLLVLEITVLVIFPVNIRTISPLLGTMLICLPASPYAAWAISGGPVRRRDEQRSQGLAQRGIGR